jgi:hypothetical protein
MSVVSENQAYVIMINDDNSMVTTQKKRIIQRSKMVDNLWFLVKPEYSGYNMADFTVVLEYVSPVSHTYNTEFLVRSADDYNGYLKYELPFDTRFTAEAGSIEVLVSFVQVELVDVNRSIQRVRKISGTTIDVIPISAWSDIIPDHALSALDQKIILLDAQIKALNDTSAMMIDSKADNITYDESTNSIQLKSGDKLIGDKVVIVPGSDDSSDGVPVINLNKVVYI